LGLVIVASTQGGERCSHCRHRSARLHSHYERALADGECDRYLSCPAGTGAKAIRSTGWPLTSSSGK
jgi:hypothetical protein